jgi:hypothetical protein
MNKKQKIYNIQTWNFADLQNIVLSACENVDVLSFTVAHSNNIMFYLNKINYTHFKKFPLSYDNEKNNSWMHKIAKTNNIYILIKSSQIADFLKFHLFKDISIDLEIVLDGDEKPKLLDQKIKKINDNFKINNLILPQKTEPLRNNTPETFAPEKFPWE